MFEPIYKEMVWGGDELSKLFGRNIPSANVGESWDISCRPDEMGLVLNGALKGTPFIDVIKENPIKVLGTSLADNESFPLLVKIITANDNLSVQVHPNDEYAKKSENYIYGKTEMWYILHAPKDSYLIIGLKDGVTKEVFKKAIEEGKTEKYLEKVYIKKGDVINIIEGLVHAITKGVVLAEVQQNSDITYRVYDYNRMGLDGKPRQLHVEKALDVIDFDGRIKKETQKGLAVKKDNNNVLTYYISNEYFTIIEYDIHTMIEDCSDNEKFFIFTCVEGSCTIDSENYSLQLNYGDSVFIPAALGEFTIVGKCKLLKSFVGNIEKDFVQPLLDAGYSKNDVELLIK